MTKIEKIKESYGEWWETLKDYVSKNGWVETEKHSKFIRNHFYLDNNIETYCDDEIEFWRPKSISGIEHNFGWTKIESESDLPNTGDICFVVDTNNFIGVGVFCTIQKIFKTRFGNEYENATHYQKIVKPQPPIY